MSGDSSDAVLSYRGKKYKLPIYESSVGPNVIDVTKFYKESGVFTYDPGFMSTASCESKITYINGEEGTLRYRGYSVKSLAEKCDFMDVSYLLLYGDLPKKLQKAKFIENLTHHSLVHEQLHFLFRGFQRRSHPMAVMVGAVGTLSAFYHETLDINDPEQRELSAHKIIAKMPTIAAMAYKYAVGQPFIYPKNELGYTENFLYMMFATPCEEFVIDPLLIRALDKIFILHADHEQNASTSTVRMAGSSGANPFACIAAGIASLWGPLHGGANEAVIRMLIEIGKVKNIRKFIDKAKDKDDPFRLMGFGHRVYKHYDPRAEVLREICHDVFKHLGNNNDHLMEIAIELEQVALKDEYFIRRKLYPNVDFYSGLIYKALKVPTEMYTVLFAIARTVGWVSQWKEMMESEEFRIARPRQLYTGHKERLL